MQKQLIYKNTARIEEESLRLQGIAETLQESLTPLFAVAENPINMADLDILFRSPKDFFVSVLVPENPTINGMTVSKTKMFDLLEIPEHILATFTGVENFVKNWEHTGKYLYSLEIKDGLIQVKESILQSIEAQNSIYIETEKQTKIYDAVLSMDQSMKTIREVLGTSSFNLTLLKQMFKIDDSFDGMPKGYGNIVFDIDYNFFKSIE